MKKVNKIQVKIHWSAISRDDQHLLANNFCHVIINSLKLSLYRLPCDLFRILYPLWNNLQNPAAYIMSSDVANISLLFLPSCILARFYRDQIRMINTPLIQRNNPPQKKSICKDQFLNSVVSGSNAPNDKQKLMHSRRLSVNYTITIRKYHLSDGATKN